MDPLEPPLQAKNQELRAFLEGLHSHIHGYWKATFAGKSASADKAFDNPGLRVVLRVVISSNAVLKDTRPIEKSGVPAFDELAASILWNRAPFNVDVPAAAVDDDGLVYLEWAFARDHRLCSDVRVVRRVEPAEEAVPRLLAAGKDEEAWAWLSDRAHEAPERTMRWYAQFELGRALKQPSTALVAAAGLLAAGDQTGVEALRAAVTQGQAGASPAAEALARARVPLCPIVKGSLGNGSPAAKQAAVEALRLAPDKACIPGLVAILGNPKEPAALRVAAFRLLAGVPGISAEPAAVEAVKAAKDDPAPTVRGAALLASVQPGSGRAAVFRMIPLLREGAVELRAAGSAGIVRAAGDAELGQLYKLFAEKDALIYELVAEELGRYATAATGDLLIKMLKREDKRVRLAAAKALLGRSDPPAHAAVETLANDADPDIKMMVLLATAPDQAAKSVAGAEPDKGRKIYRQLVGKAQYRTIFLEWILQRYRKLDATTKAEVLAEWLAGAPADGKPR